MSECERGPGKPGMGIPVDDVRDVVYVNSTQRRISKHTPFRLMYGASEDAINSEYDSMDWWSVDGEFGRPAFG